MRVSVRPAQIPPGDDPSSAWSRFNPQDVADHQAPAVSSDQPRPALGRLLAFDASAVGNGFGKAAVFTVVTLPFLALLVAIVQLWGRLVGWSDIALLVGLYVPVGLGVTAGYHRMLTHKSFRAQPVVELLLLILGSMAVEGAALTWAADHLKHHQFSDRAGDPHSPTEGLWHAHIGWLFCQSHADSETYCHALLKDRIVVFVDRTFVLWVALGLLVPFAVGGWEGLLWGGLVRTFLVHHVTWSVNSVCHTWGTRPYETTDRSRNNWAVGLLAFGEGYHNNHHRWPRAAIHGMDTWQFDGAAALIQVLERLRLVTDVYRIPVATRLQASAKSP